MNHSRLLLIGVSAALLLLLWLAQPEPNGTSRASAPVPARTFAIRDVQLFDGESVLPRATVIVREGRIVEVGVDLALPKDGEVIDGRGRTLLPGLIDAHVHTWGDARRDALRFGVTTLIDMFSDPQALPMAKAEREAGVQSEQADLWSAGWLATRDGGHGSQFGLPVPTLAGPEQAQAWVKARQQDGSDFIKIVREDLHVYSDQQRLPSLDALTAAALIEAAHGNGLRAVVHASAREAARESLQAGADGLAHVFQDAVADTALVELARERGAFVIPTLSVIARIANVPGTLVHDARLAPWLSLTQEESLMASMRFGHSGGALLSNAENSVRALHAAGVRLLAGTDAPNPGTAHGVSLHEEVQRLAALGLGNLGALIAATSAPADAFGLTDRGRIRTGLRADLLLVDGDPLADISATRAIIGIWKNGRAVDRGPARK